MKHIARILAIILCTSGLLYMAFAKEEHEYIFRLLHCFSIGSVLPYIWKYDNMYNHYRELMDDFFERTKK